MKSNIMNYHVMATALASIHKMPDFRKKSDTYLEEIRKMKKKRGKKKNR